MADKKEYLNLEVKAIFSLFQEIDEISLIVIKREEEGEKTSWNFQAYLPNTPSSLTSDTKRATTKIALANCVVVIMIIIINKLLVGISTGRNLLERKYNFKRNHFDGAFSSEIYSKIFLYTFCNPLY